MDSGSILFVEFNNQLQVSNKNSNNYTQLNPTMKVTLKQEFSSNNNLNSYIEQKSSLHKQPLTIFSSWFTPNRHEQTHSSKRQGCSRIRQANLALGKSMKQQHF
ncbi:hypothetical protein S245_016169 [Arachis hypogaea]